MNALLNFSNKNTIQCVSNLPENMHETFVKSAIDVLVNKKCDTISIKKISQTLALEQEEVFDLIGLYSSVIRLKAVYDEKEFLEALTTAGFNKSFVKAVLTSPTIIMDKEYYKTAKKLTKFNWRIDISFVYGFLKEQVPPTIIINLQLSSGKQCTFEVDLQTFHKLRFNVSLLLKELTAIEKLSLVKNKLH
ncbi:hypothetical protein FQA39_LY07136 [Lamprigera yunnana]|nr:hypothetical protein FQA39_LY07136 [Lamprigera yunnana]